MDTDLSNADASFWGESADDDSGRAVAGAGDVNADGYDDFIISAYYDDDGGTDAGQTYLILGKASGWAMDTDLSNVDASFWGENSGDYSGSSVAGAGDVNGDGFDDFLIGAYYNDDGGSNSGQTYLILGKPSGWQMDADLSNANASFIGEDIGDYCGYSVDGAGDVNGDGYDDILIGAYGDDDGGTSAGQTYLFFGKASGWAMNKDLSQANASFWGEDIGDYSARTVAGAGDVNGDGYDDFIVGAYNEDDGGTDAGQTYLILGKPTGWAMDKDLSSVNASFWGESASDYSGVFVDGNGDINGDGYDDILIGAYGDDDGGSSAGQSYLFFPDSNSKPALIDSVKAYKTDAFSTQASYASRNDTLFIELNGTDTDLNVIDTALVNVKSNTSNPVGFISRLKETGKNTGIYRGNITIMNRTNDNKGWIKASDDEIVNVSSVQDPSKYTLVEIGSPVILKPLTDNPTVIEDKNYQEHYWTNMPLVQWTFKTNASWLVWNSTTHNISGSPTNVEVGKYYVNISVTSAVWGSDEHNFTLTVNNTPPEIITWDKIEAYEDQPYYINYNSSDDGQGTITYHLKTNAGPWLAFDQSTGVLNGTPGNDDIGQYYVDDGNKGWDWSNFTLTVKNTNDAPTITSTDQLTATEDSLYSALYYATDIDKGDRLGWGLSTNTSSWLKIDSAGGVLSGIPTNANVGSCWVNVTVKDLAGAFDYHNFTLTVENVNDLPVITSVPRVTANPFETYLYDVNATDVDKGDVLTYSLDTKPVNMTIVPATGVIQWKPTKQQGGVNHIVVNVSDGHSYVTQVFDIKVSVSYSPQVTLLSPTNNSLVKLTAQILSWSWEDKDSDRVSFDVYLSKVFSYVETANPFAQIASAINNTSYAVSGLDRGSTYYWTVIPNDGSNVGKSVNGVWMFAVDNNAVVNRPPIITSTPVTTATVGKEYHYGVTARDDDIGDYLYFSLSHWPDGMTINTQTGIITWTPAIAQLGNQSVTVTVSDGKGAANQSFKITVINELPPVNHKPVISAIPDKIIKVGDDLVYQVTVTDVDALDVHTYNLENQPAGMSMSSTGIITWTPTKEQVGLYTITVKVSDGKDITRTNFNITVEKKTTILTHTGLDTMMFGIIAAVVVAIVVILVAVLALRGRRRAEPEVKTVKRTTVRPRAVPKKAPEIIKKEPEVKVPEKKKVEPEIKAKLTDEINLDDLEDED
jgi:hypothetical protein